MKVDVHKIANRNSEDADVRENYKNQSQKKNYLEILKNKLYAKIPGVQKEGAILNPKKLEIQITYKVLEPNNI